MTKLKVYSLIGLGIVIIIALFIGQEARIARLQKEKDQAISYSLADQKGLQWYKNKFEQEVAKVEMIELSNRNAAALKEDKDLKFLKLFNGLNSRLNNLESATSTTAEFHSIWDMPVSDTSIYVFNPEVGGITLPDSSLVPARWFQYEDSLNLATGIITGNMAKLDLLIVVPLYEVQYWQRERFLGLRIGRKRWYSDVTSTNPNVRIIRHRSVRVRKL